MSKKTINPSAVVIPLSKTGGILRDPLFMNPTNQEWRDKLKKTLEIWSSVPTALSLYQFYREYGIPKKKMDKWRETYPEINEMIEEVKDRIGENRWLLAFMRKSSEALFLKDIHHYHKEWREINKYHADLKKEEDKTSGIQVVYLKEVVDTGKVKSKVAKAIEVENG